MADIIKLLPETVANQIAAGEVVQRAASVVKELLENAIDAEATQIKLIIKEAGKSLIQTQDNGKGMSITDARLAFERHATSKIKETEDIFSIHTKGFRGEALASIAAVSQVEMKTYNGENEVGTQLIVEGGEFKTQNPYVGMQGTIISVKNLFYNVPARRKFLKSNNVEFRHIIDQFQRIALAHPNILFELYHNNEVVFVLKKTHLKQRIIDIFGKKIQAHLVPIEEELDWIELKGYVLKPEASRKTRSEQFFFVNDRYFKSFYFQRAVNDAFEGLLAPKYFPSYFLYINLDPRKIDVNIHPSKTEIKFENENDIYALLRTVIKKSIGVYHIAPSLDFEQQPQWMGNTLPKNIIQPTLKVNPNFNPFEKKNDNNREAKINLHYQYQSYTEEIKAETKEFFDSNINFTAISDGYWVTEIDHQLLILDLYRIHQTVLYHRLKKKFTQNGISQQLLFPLEYPISEKNKKQLDYIKEILFSIGFEFSFESEFMMIYAIPNDIQANYIVEIFDDLLLKLEDYSPTVVEDFFTESTIKFTAKKKELWTHIEEIKELFNSFEAIGKPKYSPYNKINYTIINLQDIKSLMK